MAKKKAKSAAKKPAKKKQSPVQPKLDAAVVDALKNSKASRELALDIEEKESDLSAADTAVANATAARKKAMEHRNEVDKELKQLHKDLAKLALGGFSERLPFREAAAAAAKTAKPQLEQPAATTSGDAGVVKTETVATKADADAWRSLTLAQMGLADTRTVNILVAAGFETFGAVEDHLAKVATHKADPIKKFGPEARQKYDDAKIAYFSKNPQPSAPAVEKPNGKHTAQKGDPGNASRGNAVDREKKSLTEAVDNALAFAQQEVNPLNGTKVLAKVIGSDPVAALEAATLEQLSAWQLKIRNIDSGEVISAVRSDYAN